MEGKTQHQTKKLITS